MIFSAQKKMTTFGTVGDPGSHTDHLRQKPAVIDLGRLILEGIIDGFTYSLRIYTIHVSFVTNDIGTIG